MVGPPVQAEAPATQQLSASSPEPDRAVSNPGAARKPCSDRPSVWAALQPAAGSAPAEAPAPRQPSSRVRVAAQATRQASRPEPDRAASSPGAARKPGSDLQNAPAASSLLAPRQTPSRSVSVQKQEQEPAWPFRRRRMLQSGQAVPSPAAARTPCWDPLAVPARQRPPPAREPAWALALAEVWRQRPLRPAPARLSPAQAQVAWPFRQRRMPRSGQAVPSPAAAQRPCWDRAVATAPRRRQPARGQALRPGPGRVADLGPRQRVQAPRSPVRAPLARPQPS
jgi:hypothetical protein